MTEWPAKVIPLSEIKDEWILGMAEACKNQQIEFSVHQRTTPDWGRREFLKIPRLKGTVGLPMLPGPQLVLCPDEDPWDFWEFRAYAYGPIGLGEMIIRKRLNSFEKD